jgi:peptidase inhibitor family I36
MSKSRTMVAATLTMIGCGLTAPVASADDLARVGPLEACADLRCEPAGAADSLPARSGAMPRVAHPEMLHRQQRLGFHEFGGTPAGGTAVAYVIPQGRGDDVAPGIQRLPAYQTLATDDALARGAAVIFAPGVAELAVEPQIGTLSYSSCPNGTTCIWADRDYQGRMLQFSATGVWLNLGNYGFNDSADSIANKRGGDSLLAEHTGGGGDRYCYDSFTAASTLGGFGDDASSIYLSTADSRC